MLEYQKAKYRIFNEEILSENKSKVKRSTKRYREFWKKVLRNRKNICSAIISDKSKFDLRPFATIRIFDEDVVGMIDTGATVSCIASDYARKFLSEGKRPFQKFKVFLKTADGKEHATVGSVTTVISFRGKSEKQTFLIIPNLNQNLYLGIDFVKSFGLGSDLFCENISVLGNTNGGEENFDDNVHVLSIGEKLKLDEAIGAFPSYAKKGLGRTTLVTHSIDTSDNKPVKQRYFAVSPAVEELLYREIDRMLELGVIEESQSPWSSPVALVRKPGKVRLCLDARKLNSVTVKDAYPLPLIDGILSRLPKARFISSLDLKDAFWQIPLEERSKEKTAFTVPGRPLYQFVTMPFGLCNAPQTMSRLMDRVIPANLRNTVFVYLDDLLLITETFNEHISLLHEVAFHLRKANLTINIEKSKFVLKQVKYLGHLIGHGTIRTDPDKVQAIRDYPLPKSVRQLRRFLGICGWYRRFVRNFATVSASLTDMLQKNRKFVWSEAAKSAFEELKDSLCSAPVLHNPNFSRPFSIQCDASQHGIGAVLAQTNEDGDEVPIAYMSQKLSSAQRNYTVSEQECLAAVTAVRKFRAYIEGHTFEVITDHASLKWLMSQSDLHGRLARWALKLQGFSFTIRHRKGSQNIVPDSLSRMYAENNEGIELCNMEGIFANAIEDSVEIDLNSPEFESREYLSLLTKLRNKLGYLPDIKIENGFIYKRVEYATGDEVQEQMSWKLWVPATMTHDLITRAHDHPLAAHGGVGKTLRRLKTFFFWPKMTKQVSEYVLSCDICKQTKATNKTLRPPMGLPSTSVRVFQRLYLDLLGPYPRSSSGNIGIVIVLDHLSKFHFLEPIKKFTANIIVEFLEKRIFHIFGVPESITTDNGVQFKSNVFKNFLNSYNVFHNLTAIYSPQANASERVNRSVIAAIRAYVRPSQRDWDENLSSISCALRSSVHTSTGYSPYFLLFGQNMLLNGNSYKLLRQLQLLEDPETVLKLDEKLELIRQKAQQNIRRAYERNVRSYNLRTRPVTYEPGQVVYRRNFAQSRAKDHFNSKLANQFEKAKIIARHGNCYYELQDMSGKNIGKLHAKDIRT